MGNPKRKGRKFIYRTKVAWRGEKKGLLSSSGKPAIEVATPPEFKGHEGIWTPEELFVASVNVCVETTFLYYAGRENFDFLSYESEAEGVLEHLEGRFAMSVIKIRPRIKVKSRDLVEKARELIGLSEKNCLISNSIKSRVELEPEILTEAQ